VNPSFALLLGVENLGGAVSTDDFALVANLTAAFGVEWRFIENDFVTFDTSDGGFGFSVVVTDEFSFEANKFALCVFASPAF